MAQVPTPQSATYISDKKGDRNVNNHNNSNNNNHNNKQGTRDVLLGSIKETKQTPITKITKQLDQKNIHSIKNPLYRVISIHERLRSFNASLIDIIRDTNNYSINEVNNLETSVDKIFDLLVSSLEESTSSNDDPQWEDSQAKE